VGMRTGMIGVGLVLLFAVTAADAEAIPAFARKYHVSCSLCHGPVPRLTSFGETFAANGFEFQPGEAPRDTIQTGDPLLRLQADLPLAIRFDGYMSGWTEAPQDGTSWDLETPWAIKLLTGGQITNRVSYYLYFFMFERGEVAGLEDAYLQFTDLFSSGVSVIAGQFQVSDPLFKRELRLEFEDYAPYRVRVGNATADLTYERGLMGMMSPWNGGDLVLGIANGQGLAGTNAARQFDVDNGKTVFARLSHSFSAVRVGGFGYYNSQRSAAGAVDETVVWGPDATLALGNMGELNVELLRRTDSNPAFLALPPGAHAKTDMGLAELVLWPQGQAGRLFWTALYNHVRARDGVPFTLRLGEPGPLLKYDYVAGGVHYLLVRNVRLMTEVGLDINEGEGRLTLGLVTAF
jgi:hypothetical protein